MAQRKTSNDFSFGFCRRVRRIVRSNTDYSFFSIKNKKNNNNNNNNESLVVMSCGLLGGLFFGSFCPFERVIFSMVEKEIIEWPVEDLQSP